jgi:hypothetical protein
VWRKVKSDWDAWNARSLADELRTTMPSRISRTMRLHEAITAAYNDM